MDPNNPKYRKSRPEFDYDADGNPISYVDTEIVTPTIRTHEEEVLKSQGHLAAKRADEKTAADRFDAAVRNFAGNFIGGVADGMAASSNDEARTSGAAMRRGLRVFDVRQDTSLGKERGVAAAEVAAFGLSENKRKVFEEDARQLTTYRAGNFESRVPPAVSRMIALSESLNKRMAEGQRLRDMSRDLMFNKKVTY